MLYPRSAPNFRRVWTQAVMPELAVVETGATEAFLAGGGEMGALIRGFNWSACSLGPPAGWPQALRTSVRLMLTSGHPMYIFWGQDGAGLYNDAYRQSLGPERHPSSLGQPGCQVWSEIWDVIGPQVAKVMSGRGATWHENHLIPVTRHGRREDVYWTYSYSPIDDEAAPNGVGGVLVVCAETTQTVLAERRQTFLVDLGDTLARLVRPDAILDGALQALGGHLRAARVGYGEVCGEDEIALTTPYTDGVAPLTGIYPLSGFGPAVIARNREGITVVCDDVAAREDLGGNAWTAIDTRAFVSAPLVRAGVFRASLFVNQREPRPWAPQEVALIEAVAARIWDALERARAEAALRNSEARFRAALQATGILWTNDANGQMAGEQPGWAALTGQTPAEYGGYGWSEAVHPDDAQPTLEGWRQAVADRRMFVFEHRVRGRDGLYRPFAIRAVPVLGEDGAVREWVGVHTDIADQRAAEAKLRELNATLEQRVRERTRERDRMWQNSRDLLITLGSDGIFQAVSPAFSKILGYDMEEVVGRHVLEFVHGEDKDATMGALSSAANARDLTDFHNRHVHKDGTLRTISWYTSTEGDVIYAYGRDITAEEEKEAALRRAEEQLRQSQKMEAVGQLTGGLAHDFNNLLTGIAGSLELLETRLAQGRTADAPRYIGAAQGAARRAAALTQRLLAFSRRQTLDPRPVNMNRLVAGMDDLIRRAIGPAVELEIVGAAGLWICLVDPHQLENALLNLCINARDAMPDGGRLTIETANRWMDARAAQEQDLPQGQYISLSVTDTGTGMAPEVAARAFDPFFTTKPLGEGTGLGLSMIYGFARQSGGQIRIYSELGRGTTMCLYLPRSDALESALDDAEEMRRRTPSGTGETVLIVDDEPTVRMLVIEVLEDLGYNAIEAADGAAGLKVLQSAARINLLITDVGLPGGMNGRQLADAGRAARPEMRVLFITGYAENAVVGNGHLEAGMEILTKPFAMDVLAERIRGLIEQRK